MPFTLGQVMAGAALVMLATACSSTTGAPFPASGHGGASGASAPGTVGFLHTDSSLVAFLQWPIDSSGNVNGTAKEDYLTGNASNEVVRDSTGDFTGQINESGGVTLSFSWPWGTVYGAESGNTLTLNLPLQGGGLQATTFRSATPDDYNAALATLQNAASQANQEAQLQQQQASQAAAQSNAQQALNKDLAGLSDDENKLSSALSAIPAAERRIDSTSATTDSKLAAEKAYAGPKADCYQLSNMEYATNSAVYDLNSAVYDLNSDIGSVDTAVRALSSDIGQAQKDEQADRAVGGNVPSNTDGALSTASNDVAGAKASEQKAQTYGDSATKHGQDVSNTADSLTTNCNTGG